jgi:hypothetical protein
MKSFHSFTVLDKGMISPQGLLLGVGDIKEKVGYGREGCLCMYIHVYLCVYVACVSVYR